MTLIELTVVLPTWNGEHRIVDALESLVTQTMDPRRFEILVVDDGSSDLTSDVVIRFGRKHSNHEIRCLRERHGGVNAARNAGVRAARGRFISFFDDDQRAPADHCARVVTFLDESSSALGIGGPARLLGEPAFRTCAECSIGEARLPIDGVGASARLLGGNMTIRRELFDEVGLFDETISGRGDETEWFARVEREFVYDDTLVVWHRRDHMSTADLLRSGFRQGAAAPTLHARLGDERWRPSPTKIIRSTGHAVCARCTNGLLQASRELGALSAWARRFVPGRGTRA